MSKLRNSCVALLILGVQTHFNHCSEYSSHNLYNWAGDHSTLWPAGITQKEACFPSDEHVEVKHGVILFRSFGEYFEPYVSKCYSILKPS